MIYNSNLLLRALSSGVTCRGSSRCFHGRFPVSALSLPTIVSEPQPYRRCISVISVGSGVWVLLTQVEVCALSASSSIVRPDKSVPNNFNESVFGTGALLIIGFLIGLPLLSLKALMPSGTTRLGSSHRASFHNLVPQTRTVSFPLPFICTPCPLPTSFMDFLSQSNNIHIILTWARSE